MQAAPDGRSVCLGITGVTCLRVGQPWFEHVDFEHVARVLGKEGAAVYAPTQMRLDAAQVAGLVPLLGRATEVHIIWRRVADTLHSGVAARNVHT